MPCGTTTTRAVGLLVVAVLASQLHRASALRLVTPQNKRDLVTRLPDYPLPVEHYAGHIVVGSKRTTRIFYYFVPALHRPTTSPIIVWMQNTLMCSSMVGLVYEHGPFRLNVLDKRSLTMQVTPNPHSWHKAANVIYVDAPGGMGFSTAKDVGMDADAAAGQMLQFLVGFYARHAAMRRLPLYLAAETSGVPTMLITAQRLARELPAVPLKGYIAISGWTNQCQYWQAAQPRFLLEQRLISASAYRAIAAACGRFCQAYNKPCEELEFLRLQVLTSSERTTRLPATCPVDPITGRRVSSNATALQAGSPADRIDASYTGAGPSVDQVNASSFPAGSSADAVGSSSFQAHPPVGSPSVVDADAARAAAEAAEADAWPVEASWEGRRLLQEAGAKVPGGKVTCGDFSLAALYFNRNDVRKALHLPPMDPSKPATRWEACGGFSVPTDRFNPATTPTFPRHRDLLVRLGLRALLLHGAQDFDNPYSGTRRLAADVGLQPSLGATILRVRGRRVGAMKAYGGGRGRQLNFVVLEGAGAFVTEDKPAASLEVLKRFVGRRNLEA